MSGCWAFNLDSGCIWWSRSTKWRRYLDPAGHSRFSGHCGYVPGSISDRELGCARNRHASGSSAVTLVIRRKPQVRPGPGFPTHPVTALEFNSSSWCLYQQTQSGTTDISQLIGQSLVTDLLEMNSRGRIALRTLTWPCCPVWCCMNGRWTST